MTSSSTGFRYSGLGVAVLGFVLTRLLVAETLQADAVSFMVAGLLPLAAGLGMTVFGVALAVGAFTPAYARTVWLWAAAGTFGMTVVLTTTAAHSVLIGEGFDPLLESSPLVANVLLGGAIGGVVVGDRSAASRRQHENLARYAERTMLANRLLRHEILNATAIVKGYAGVLGDGGETGDDPDEASSVILESAEQIEGTVDEVNAFARTDGTLAPIDLGSTLESVLADLPDDEDVRVDNDVPRGTLVRADDRVGLVVRELLENAIEHTGPDASVEFTATAGPRTVTLTVSDTGPGLPEPAQEVLAARSIPEYDDPRFGYGLQMFRLVVEHYGGDLETETGEGTAITVTLQRTEEAGVPPLGLGVPRADLYRVSTAALLAGLAMGAFLQATAEILPVVGTLYGVQSRVVGWVTHLFHSVVFGLLFAAACARPRLRDLASSLRGKAALGVGWGVALWLVAAGLIMPVWLIAVDQPATLPDLSPIGLLAHLLWGGLLGGLYAVLPAPGRFRR